MLIALAKDYFLGLFADRLYKDLCHATVVNLSCLIFNLLFTSALAQVQTTDLSRAKEVNQILALYGEEIWPGWQPQVLLLRGGNKEYLFNPPSHNPPFEKPEKMRPILPEDVLAGRINLADKK